MNIGEKDESFSLFFEMEKYFWKNEIHVDVIYLS